MPGTCCRCDGEAQADGGTAIKTSLSLEDETKLQPAPSSMKSAGA